jgi:hypothetical protein
VKLHRRSTLPDAAEVWQFTAAEVATIVHSAEAKLPIGRVYVIHLDPPYRHARHYIGIAQDGNVARRVAEHAAGRGSRLCLAAVRAGCRLLVVLVVPGTLGTERRMHNRHGTRVCPRCR